MLKGVIKGEIIEIGWFFDSIFFTAHLPIIFNSVSSRSPVSSSAPTPDIGPKTSLKERVAFPEAEDVELDFALLVVFD